MCPDKLAQYNPLSEYLTKSGKRDYTVLAHRIYQRCLYRRDCMASPDSPFFGAKDCNKCRSPSRAFPNLKAK